MHNEVVESASNAVSTNVASGSFSSQVDASDIVIPKVLLMQSISVLVEQEKAKAGEFIHSMDENVVAKKGSDFEIIVMGMYKNIRVSENGKYIKTIEFDKNLPWETMDGKVKVNNLPTYNYYCLLVNDIKEMKPFPHVITFKGNSFKKGKKLNTRLVMLEEFDAPIWAKTFKICATPEENDKGKYYVMDIMDGRKSTEVELKLASKWSARLMSSGATVHENDEGEAQAKSNNDFDPNASF